MTSGNTVLLTGGARFGRPISYPSNSDIVELLLEQLEVCAGHHLRPYNGDEDGADGLHHFEAKRGTTAFHAYATLCARVRNKRCR